MVNIIKFPEPGAVIFVGTTDDPKDFDTKAEPELGIKEMRFMHRHGDVHAQGGRVAEGGGRARRR